MGCASRRSAPTGTSGWERASGCSTSRRVIRIGCSIELNALATRVLFDADNRAIGVEYLKGERLYRAHPGASDAAGEPRVVRAGREVILAGGAFNTPQLLMLSGIGPRDALERHGIAVRVDLPGVGRNLQDRYEIGVVNRMAQPWRVLTARTSPATTGCSREWSRHRTGMYVSNGAALAVSLRSQPDLPRARPVLHGAAGEVRGLLPGLFARHRRTARLPDLGGAEGAHQQPRRRGRRCARPIRATRRWSNFRYFEEGSDTAGDDLKAVVTALRFVRRMTAGTAGRRGLIAQEELPGETVQTDEQLADYVRDNAWGHHASCSCAIGPREANGVLDSRLRVHGTERLRVVDASVFPRIPGFFIVGAVYMVAEKAADMILADAARSADGA